jgi:UDP-3-O-[3-hydroxymyristoyl] glucosamine N-acyltransferase
MADSRFFTRAGPFTVAEIAERTGATLGHGADPTRVLTDVAPLELAAAGDLSFLDNRKYVDSFVTSQAGAAFVRAELAARAPASMAALVAKDPYKAYARAAQAFYPDQRAPAGVAPTAVIDPSAKLGKEVSVGPYAVIGPGAEIGDRCRIGAHAVIEGGVVLAEDVRIESHCTLSHTFIGPRTRIFPGVRIGQDGFGFAPDPSGHVRVPQLGRVLIGADVEIGANTTIDRGAGPDTIVGDGTMIDNLVQIGHNVAVGRGCVLVAQVGVSGSTKLGDFVMAGGQAGLAGHLTVGSGARIAAKGGVMRDVPAGVTVCGFPAVPIAEFMRQVAVLQRLAKKRGE